MTKTVDEWMQEGEELYTATMSHCHQMETEVSEAQKRLAAKQDEANRIAKAIGKPAAVETSTSVVTSTSTTPGGGSNNRLRIFGWVAASLGVVGFFIWFIVGQYKP